jgi:hypothetical protein
LRTETADGTVVRMALRATVLSWLRRTPDKSDELEEAEIDAASEEYSEKRSDDFIDEFFMTSRNEFEGDQDAPRR